MGAFKNFCQDCAMAGFVPCNNEVFRRLDELEDQLDLDWIEYMEHPYLGFDGKEYHADGISIDSAYRLQDMGVKIDDIDVFLELFVVRDGDRWRSITDAYWTSEYLQLDSY